MYLECGKYILLIAIKFYQSHFTKFEIRHLFFGDICGSDTLILHVHYALYTSKIHRPYIDKKFQINISLHVS